MTARELKDRYENGDNVMSLLRDLQSSDVNTEEMIETSYDLQTGSYTARMALPEHAARRQATAAEMSDVLGRLTTPGSSVLEPGVGEGMSLSAVLDGAGLSPTRAFGLDVSWSRVAYARRWLSGRGHGDATLCTGSLLRLPFASGSVDVVFTAHAVEPNRGSEAAVLRELYRVAREHVVLFEPAYELADDEQRARMDRHGYCRGLVATAEAEGYEVAGHWMLESSVARANPTAATVIRKDPAPRPDHVLACPRHRTPLDDLGDVLFSPEALVAYPVLLGVPCLRVENGVVASKYPEVLAER